LEENCPQCLSRGSPCGTSDLLHKESPSLLQVEAENTESSEATRTMSEKVLTELHELLETVKLQGKAIEHLESQQSELLHRSTSKKHKSKEKQDAKDSILKEGNGFPEMDNLMRFQQRRSKGSKRALLKRILDDAVEFIED